VNRGIFSLVQAQSGPFLHPAIEKVI